MPWLHNEEDEQMEEGIEIVPDGVEDDPQGGLSYAGLTYEEALQLAMVIVKEQNDRRLGKPVPIH